MIFDGFEVKFKIKKYYSEFQIKYFIDEIHYLINFEC